MVMELNKYNFKIIVVFIRLGFEDGWWLYHYFTRTHMNVMSYSNSYSIF